MRITAIRSAACCLAAFATLTGAEGAGAQSTASVLPTVREEIVVTADRLEAEKDTVGSSVTVIDREEIARRRKRTVAELLRTVPGVEISRSAGPGSVTSAFLRGGSSSFTLVLIDGVRVNSPATGSFDLSQITTDNVDRIEIVRGQASTVYGSEAIGGVIAITTSAGGGPFAIEAAAEAGSDGFDHLRGGVSGGRGKVAYSFQASRTAIDGISAAAERFGNTEDDGDTNHTISGRLGWAWGEDKRVDLALRYVDADTDIDAFGFDPARGFVPVDDPNAVQSRRTLVGSLEARLPIGERVTQTVRLGIHDEDLEATDPDSPFNNFGSDVQVLRIGSESAIEVSRHGTFLVGAEHEERDATVRDGFDRGTSITSVLAQQRWATERGSLVVGLRHDDHTTFGGETTWRLTGSWAWGERDRRSVRLHGSVGSGFRAPSLNELFFPFFGNPDLAPETSTGFDVGVEGSLLGERFIVDLTAFDNDFEDLIGISAAFTAINIDRASARGFELTATWVPSERWSLAASHTFTDSEDESTGLRLARRPENRSTALFTFDANERLDGALSLIVVRDRVDTGGAPMDDYERVDLTLGWRLQRSFDLYLRTENLFDQDYQEVPGFGTPGLTAAFGIRWGA